MYLFADEEATSYSQTVREVVDEVGKKIEVPSDLPQTIGEYIQYELRQTINQMAFQKSLKIHRFIFL